MNLFEYMSEMQDRADRDRAQMGNALKRVWLAIVAAIFAVVGLVFVGLTFKSTRTETTGHLWAKHTKTIDVPLSTRLLYLFIGLVLIAIAALCVTVMIRRSARRAAEKKYLAILTGDEVYKVHQIASITNLSTSKVYSDIQRMIDSGTIDDFYIDYANEQVVSRKYIPKSSHKTVVACRACGANNELIVGITKPCGSCGEPLAISAS